MLITILDEIYDITLTKLNLSSNSISSLLLDVCNLINLQELYLYNNNLTSLPVEI
jgi:Leucine-rich repeat (LRR) protein